MIKPLRTLFSRPSKPPHPKASLRFLMFSMSLLFVFYKYVLEVSPSILEKPLIKELHINATLFGHIAASYYYAYMVMQIPAGILIDSFGPRIVTTIGLTICGLGALLFGISQNLFLISLARFLMGSGAVFAILNTMKISTNWFPAKQFSFLFGLTLTLGIFGAIFSQTPLAYLTNIFGWRFSFMNLAIFGFIFALFFFLTVRNHPPHKAYDVTPKTQGKVKLSAALLHTLKRRQTWILSFYSGLAFTPMLSFAGLWGVSFIETKYLLKVTEASFFTSLAFIGFAIGAPILGWYSSFVGKRKPILFIGTLMAWILICLVTYAPPLPLPIFAIILFFMGFFLSGSLLSFAIIHEINIPLMTATAIGIMNTFDAFFGAVTDPFIGFFLDFFGKIETQEAIASFSISNFQRALTILPTYLLIALILSFFIKETHCIQTIEEKTS